jgi:tetratricopeptide (TPR) repeat protein
VIAWNEAMEELSGVPAEVMVGKGERTYSESFLGRKRPILIDLIYATDPELEAQNFHLVNREKGAIIAWTRVVRPGENDRIFWMRAMPLHDGKGSFVGAVGSVRDITEIAGTVIREPVPDTIEKHAKMPASPAKGADRLLSIVTGKAKAEYKAGVKSYYDDGNLAEALSHFDQALEINPSLAHVWNERGLCLKDMGKYEDAIKSFEQALSFSPRDEEYLFDYGEVLEMMGVLTRERKYLENAIRTFAAVTEINPDNASAWNHLGICIKETGRDEESRQAFERSRTILRLKKDRMFRRKRETHA